MIALSRSDIFKLHYTSNSHRGWRNPWSHPIRSRPPPEVVAQAIAHRDFAALHFTGSMFVFKKLWKVIAANVDKYKSYPRNVGEAGATISCRLGEKR